MVLLVSILVIGTVAPVPPDNPKAGKPLEQLAGTWIATSVKHSGEELFDPPSTGNLMRFDGMQFVELTGTGKTLLEGKVQVVAGRGSHQIDLPRKRLMPGVAARVVTIAGICRFTGKDELQICYFDPDLVAPGAKRPEKFESTPANGAVLITMKRKP